MSDAPWRAPANHRELPPCTQRSSEAWDGSDIPARALRGVPAHYVEEALRCAACASTDTRCISLYSNTGVSWAVMEVEVVCEACRRYTLWAGED